MVIKYWEGNTRVYHHTAPINMIYALYQALALLLEEGLDSAYGVTQRPTFHWSAVWPIWAWRCWSMSPTVCRR